MKKFDTALLSQFGVRSILAISDLSQLFKVKALIPPTLLIGFKKQNRFLRTDENGYIKVKNCSDCIMAEEVQQYLNEHMKYGLDEGYTKFQEMKEPRKKNTFNEGRR